jgi:hypothetical protein
MLALIDFALKAKLLSGTSPTASEDGKLAKTAWRQKRIYRISRSCRTSGQESPKEAEYEP